MGQAHGDVGTWLHEGMLGTWLWGRCTGTWVHHETRKREIGAWRHGYGDINVGHGYGDKHMQTQGHGCTMGPGNMRTRAWGRGCDGQEHEDRGTCVHNRQRGHGGHECGDGGRHTGTWTHKGTWGPGWGGLGGEAGQGTGMPSHRDMDTGGSPGDIRGVLRAGATPATPTASLAQPSAPSTWRMWSGRSRDTSLSPGVLRVPGPPCPRSGCPGPGTPHPAGSPGCIRGPCPHAGCATGLAAVPGWAQPLPSSPPGTSPTRRWPSPRSTRCCTAPWPPPAGGPSSPAPAPGARGQGGWARGHRGGIVQGAKARVRLGWGGCSCKSVRGPGVQV